MHGCLFKYGTGASHLAFLSGSGSTPPQVAPPPWRRHLVLLGGLSDGLLFAPYAQQLADAVGEKGFGLVQASLASSYQGYGVSSLDGDASDLLLLCQCLRTDHGCTEGLVLMGHSTGCQDIIRYAQRYGHLGRSPHQSHHLPCNNDTITLTQEHIESHPSEPSSNTTTTTSAPHTNQLQPPAHDNTYISSTTPPTDTHLPPHTHAPPPSSCMVPDILAESHVEPPVSAPVPAPVPDPAPAPAPPPLLGLILQAPVSDREYLAQFPHLAQYVEPARQAVGEGRGGDIVFRFTDLDGAPMSASRFLSLYERGGDDDMFSDDLTPQEMQERVGHLRDWPVLVVHSGSDECLADPGSSIKGLQQRLSSAIEAHHPTSNQSAGNKQPLKDSMQPSQQLPTGQCTDQPLLAGGVVVMGAADGTVGTTRSCTSDPPTAPSPLSLELDTGPGMAGNVRGSCVADEPHEAGRPGGFLDQQVIEEAGHQAAGYEAQLADMVVRFLERIDSQPR